MSAYSIIQFHQSSTLIDDDQGTKSEALQYLLNAYQLSKWAEITQICVMIVSTMIFVFLAYKLYLEFGWHIYKKIGADLAMRGDYQFTYISACTLTEFAYCRSLQNVSDLHDAAQI